MPRTRRQVRGTWFLRQPTTVRHSLRAHRAAHKNHLRRGDPIMASRIPLSSCLTVLLAISGLRCSSVEPEVREVDLSDFREFEFSQGVYFGGCYDGDDRDYSVWIRRQDDGSYTVEFSAVEDYGESSLWWEDVDSWGNSTGRTELSYYQGEIIVPAQPPRTLTDAEVQRVLEVFRSLTIHSVMTDGNCWDFCKFLTPRWDDFQPETQEVVPGCEVERIDVLDSADLAEIIDLLDELRQGDQQPQ
jgi:hypothetical protein